MRPVVYRACSAWNRNLTSIRQKTSWYAFKMDDPHLNIIFSYCCFGTFWVVLISFLLLYTDNLFLELDLHLFSDLCTWLVLHFRGVLYSVIWNCFLVTNTLQKLIGIRIKSKEWICWNEMFNSKIQVQKGLYTHIYISILLGHTQL